jgi:hypothetical protein
VAPSRSSRELGHVRALRQGDALASDRQALARDGARAAAYVVGPLALLAGGPLARAAVATGAVLYFSVPLARARHEQRPLATAVLVPPVIALKDLAKAWGAAQVLLERRLQDRQHAAGARRRGR